MVAWRLAVSLEKLRSQVNASAPGRNKRSDGTIGDAAHLSRNSDHNPWIDPPSGENVVSAADFTDDPQNGFSARTLALAIVASRDDRVKYIIHNRVMWRSYDKPDIPAWTPAPYHGVNQHLTHMHISVKPQQSLYDDSRSWPVPIRLAPASPSASPSATKGRYDMKTIDLRNAHRTTVSNKHVDNLQGLLLAAGYGPRGIVGSDGRPDGIAGDATRAAVGHWQRKHHDGADYIVGPNTWKALIEY